MYNCQKRDRTKHRNPATNRTQAQQNMQKRCKRQAKENTKMANIKREQAQAARTPRNRGSQCESLSSALWILEWYGLNGDVWSRRGCRRGCSLLPSRILPVPAPVPAPASASVPRLSLIRYFCACVGPTTQSLLAGFRADAAGLGDRRTRGSPGEKRGESANVTMRTVQATQVTWGAKHIQHRPTRRQRWSRRPRGRYRDRPCRQPFHGGCPGTAGPGWTG